MSALSDKPTDDQVMAIIRYWGGSFETGALRNLLGYHGFKNLKTADVLLSLQRLELSGKISEFPGSSEDKKFWRVVE